MKFYFGEGKVPKETFYLKGALRSFVPLLHRFTAKALHFPIPKDCSFLWGLWGKGSGDKGRQGRGRRERFFCSPFWVS